MELGLTIPLRRHLSLPQLPPGGEPDLALCWDLHVIPLRGRPSLLAVHCQSRFVFVRYDPAPRQWANLPQLFRQGLADALSPLPAELSAPYLRAAEPLTLTRTHGRRPVAFLNRAWEDVTAADLALDPDVQPQPLLDALVNQKPSRCAGFPGLSPACGRWEDSLRRFLP